MIYTPDNMDTSEFGEVLSPPHNEYDARQAVLGPDGGESHIRARDCQFIMLNRVEAAAHAAASAVSQAPRLERELRAVERKLSWTAPTVLRASTRIRRSWFNLLLALLVFAFGALGMVVSNLVLSEYALRSSSGLFQANRVGAVLFATLPCLGAVALKVFELRLVSANARWLYGAVIFALGITSLGVWLAAAALIFAPETTASAALLSQGASDRWIGIILVLTTIVCDVTLGATLLSGVGHLLSERQNSEAIPNPNYAALVKRRRQLEDLVAQLNRKRAMAEDYLSRAAAGRELTRLEAEHEVERARELWMQVQYAALAFAIAIFLSAKEDKPCDPALS
jgi:hypothetical protein